MDIKMTLSDKIVKKYNRDGFIPLISSGWKYGHSRIIDKLSYIPILHYLIICTKIREPSPDYVDDTRLYNKHFWFDRFLEIKNFYGKNYYDFSSFYAQNGFPHRSKFVKRIVENSDDVGFGPPEYSPPPEELLEMYDKTSFYDVNRMMIAYHRYNIANEYVEIIKKNDLSGFSILDYGCGVGDPDIYLGLKEADITIVDIGEKLDFASWRLEQREIEHTDIKARQTEEPVELRSNFDLIIMNEFLEHVRNPKVFLQTAIDKLPPGGILYDAFGREYTHTVNYQHLKEAKQVAESEEYKQLHRRNFDKMEKPNFYKRSSEADC